MIEMNVNLRALFITAQLALLALAACGIGWWDDQDEPELKHHITAIVSAIVGTYILIRWMLIWVGV